MPGTMLPQGDGQRLSLPRRVLPQTYSKGQAATQDLLSISRRPVHGRTSCLPVLKDLSLRQTPDDRCRYASFETIKYSFRKAYRNLSPLHDREANIYPMELQTLKDLYIHELKDLFSAEQQLVKALPKMAKAATNKELVGGFQEHLEQTKGHLNG